VANALLLDARASHASPATSLLTWIDQSVLQLIVTEEHVELHGMIVIEMWIFKLYVFEIKYIFDILMFLEP